MNQLFSDFVNSTKVRKSLLFTTSAIAGGLACAALYNLARRNIPAIHSDAPRAPKAKPTRKYSRKFWRESQPAPLAVHFDENFRNCPSFPRKRIEEELQASDLFSLFDCEEKNSYFTDVVITSNLDFTLPVRVRQYCFLIYCHTVRPETRSFEGIPAEELDIYSKNVYVNRFDLGYLPFKHDPDEIITEKSYFDENQRPPIAILFTPETGKVLVRDVESFLEFVYRRVRIRWFEWVKMDEERDVRLLSLVQERPDPLQAVAEIFKKSSKILRFAQESHLLIDTPGNLSYRVKDQSDYFLVTPTGVDKTLLVAQHFVLGRFDFQTRTFDYWSDISKPSIDAGCQAYLYAKCKNIVSFFHFHYQKYILVFPRHRTQFPFPCGTIEEPQEIISVLTQQSNKSKSFNTSFCIDMLYHGYLFGLTKKDYEDMFQLWDWIVDTIMKRHRITDSRKNIRKMKKQLYPLFFNYSIGGGILRKMKRKSDEMDTVVIYLLRSEVDRISAIRKEMDNRRIFIGKIILINRRK